MRGSRTSLSAASIVTAFAGCLAVAAFGLSTSVGATSTARGAGGSTESRGVAQQAAPALGDALGIVEGQKAQAVGIVAADGVVLTSAAVAEAIAADATFTPIGSSSSWNCYIAAVNRPQQIAALRCGDLDLAPLKVAPAEAVGTTLWAVVPGRGDVPELQQGSLLDEGVPFMRSDQPRFSFGSPTDDAAESKLTGAPVVNADGALVSMLFAVPESGVQPLGLTPRQIRKAIEPVSAMPATYASAVLRRIGETALIPVAVALVIGALLAWRSKVGSRASKIVGPVALAIVCTVLFAGLQYLLGGPASLLG